MKYTAIAIIIVLSTVLFTSYLIPLHPSASSSCAVTASDINPPSGSTKIISVTMTVTNDEDSGMVG
ncbi:MAG: hypothetical protein JRN52_00685 [Nitrososphaerota archaeon]|nr:hypothetical protein [Nitrososphaerota archaeon]